MTSFTLRRGFETLLEVITALIVAARFGYHGICRTLLACGANRSAAVRGNQIIGCDGTAAEVAQTWG